MTPDQPLGSGRPSRFMLSGKDSASPLVSEQLLFGADAVFDGFLGELQVEPGFFGSVLVKLADLALAFAAVRRVFFRGLDPGAVVVVASPGALIENRALAHLAGRPCVFGLG